MYFVTATRTSSDTRWITCNPDVPGRLRISPAREGHESLTEARKALGLALDWFSSEGPGYTIELKGPLGVFSSHYFGPALAG